MVSGLVYERNGIKISLGDYPLVEDDHYTAMYATDRRAIVDLLDETKKLHGGNGCFEITMPCGYSQVFRENSDIPVEDLPCPCGKDGRYLVRYKKEEL